MSDSIIPGWTPNEQGVPTAPPSGPQGPDDTSGNAPEREAARLLVQATCLATLCRAAMTEWRN
jgi:hypothetical protein